MMRWPTRSLLAAQHRPIRATQTLDAMSHCPKPVLPPLAPNPLVAQAIRAALPLRWCLVACALLLAACMPTRPAPSGVEFVIVRHAEKADDGTRDPPLSAAGKLRAVALATGLRDAPLRAAYATAYQRTQQTATPAATLHGLSVVTYDAGQPAIEFAARLRRDHLAGTVLVVGHSNSAPAIASALCGCAASELGENDYGRVYRIRIGADGRAGLSESAAP